MAISDNLGFGGHNAALSFKVREGRRGGGEETRLAIWKENETWDRWAWPLIYSDVFMSICT